MMGTPPTCPLRQASETDGLTSCEYCKIDDGQPCFPCRELIELEAQILEAKQVLNALLLLRSGNRKRVNRSHDPITTRLPPEIVSDIFEFSLPDKWEFADSLLTFKNIDAEEEDGTSVPVLGPLRLGAVCTAWRTIAWSTPSLWKVMRLNLDRCANSNDRADLAKDWLDRSGQLPLSIHISYFPDFRHNRPTMKTTQRLLAAMDTHSRQWENLDVVGPDWLISGIQGSLQGAPNLRRLRISYQSTTASADYQHRPFSLSGPRPRVSHLTLDHCRLRGVHVEWSALTSLVAAGLTLDECIHVFKLAPQIMHCDFYAMGSFTGAFPIPSDPIISLYLKSLKLTWNEDQHPFVMDFLHSVTFPNLDHFHMEISGNNIELNNTDNWGPLAAHVARSSPPLTSLTVYHRFLTQPVTGYLIPMLRMTPLLRHLRITDPFSDDESRDDGAVLFNLLSTTAFQDQEGREGFLPMLESIEFKLEVDRHSFWESVLEIFGPLAQIKSPGRRPLNTLRIRCEMAEGEYYFASQHLVQRLLELERAGIALDIRDATLDFDMYELSLEHHGLSRYE